MIAAPAEHDIHGCEVSAVEATSLACLHRRLLSRGGISFMSFAFGGFWFAEQCGEFGDCCGVFDVFG
jgi:hypothetical protein